MNSIIDAALDRSRMVLLILALILGAGVVAYLGIPKEAAPEVKIPIIYVSMSHDGISPADAERLLVKPMEKELRSIEGIKEMRSTASEGHASVLLEFDAGFDADRALVDVREKVDVAQGELPEETDEPTVTEINTSDFPVMVVTLSGGVPERTLFRLARNLKDAIETLPTILEANVVGDREEVLDVLVDPLLLESYNISNEELVRAINLNNRLVAAGALDSGQGRFSVKVPGLFETAADVLDLPIKVNGDGIVTLDDVTTIRRTFKDATTFARLNGEPAVALEIVKRAGTNIIENNYSVRAVVDAVSGEWPAGVDVTYSQDQSEFTVTILGDLQNNVISAIILVMIVVVAALGLRGALLVGVAIPGSFLFGILMLATLGLTMNMVVMFSLILAVGMLVDGAIVVTEFADRRMAEGMPRRQAYAAAAKRMAWPITASTATTLAAFMPLLFWPGIIGEFMVFLPITLIGTLVGSLLMALIFVPALGSYFGRPGNISPRAVARQTAAENRRPVVGNRLPRPVHSHAVVPCAPPLGGRLHRRRLARRGLGLLLAIRQRRHFLRRHRSRQCPRPGARARQHVDRGKRCAGARGRGPRPRHPGHRDRVRTHLGRRRRKYGCGRCHRLHLHRVPRLGPARPGQRDPYTDSRRHGEPRGH